MKLSPTERRSLLVQLSTSLYAQALEETDMLESTAAGFTILSDKTVDASLALINRIDKEFEVEEKDVGMQYLQALENAREAGRAESQARLDELIAQGALIIVDGETDAD